MDFTKYFPRVAEEKIVKWLREYVVVVLGARQVGKTTLLEKIAAKNGRRSFFYSLDDVLLRHQFAGDFHFLLKDLEAKLGKRLEDLEEEILVIVDEAQKEPTVFEAVKILYERFGRFVKIILSGSASLEVRGRASESLAGRAQLYYLHPLSLAEIINARLNLSSPSIFPFLADGSLNKEILFERQAIFYPQKERLDELLKEILTIGLLPGIWQKEPDQRPDYWRGIVSLYFEKDIRAAGLVKDLENFQHFLEICAFQIGGILNLENLSQQIQVSVNTLRQYRSILRDTFVLNLLPPFTVFPQKRMVKSHKCYFYDVGAANFLTGRTTFANVFDSKSFGGIFENVILKSFEAYVQNEAKPTHLYFWRDYQEREIDLVVKTGEATVPIEITYGSRPEKSKINNLVYFLENERQANFGLLLYSGELKEIEIRGQKILCVPWWLWQ